MTILPVRDCGLVGGPALTVVFCEEGNVGLLVDPGPVVVDGGVVNNSIRNTNYAYEICITIYFE